MKSESLLPITLTETEDGFSMSVYQGLLTKECVALETIKIESAFPSLPKGFYAVFYDQIKKMNFTDERLEDAVDHVIRTCEYPTPTIAKFLSWDSTVELYTHQQLVDKNAKYQGIFKQYKSVRISDLPKPYFAHLNDIEKYKLELWNKES